MKYIFFIIVIVLLIFSCASTMLVKDVEENPQMYEGKNLTIEGEVTDTLSSIFDPDGLYRVFDAEYESIWVYTKNLPMPKRGSVVVVKGQLQKRDDLRRRIFGLILVEKSRKVIIEPGKKK